MTDRSDRRVLGNSAEGSGDQIVATRIVDRLERGFTKRLEDLSSPVGFVPQSFSELEASIDELFGDTLTTLAATSICSQDRSLASYRDYWEDNRLGPFFKERNDAFLSRSDDRRLLRVFVCDSLAAAVAEDWFRETVVRQVSRGAAVRVLEMHIDNPALYEDFGVYEHRTGAIGRERYLLLAPYEINREQHSLTAAVIADPDVVAEYAQKFDTVWEQCPALLEIITSPVADEADRQSPQSCGVARVTDVFGHRVVLRNLQRLDSNERLMDASAGFVRKYETRYAKAVSDHIERVHPDVGRLLYLGDSYKHDGTAIRNLQALGWTASGFICDPQLGISRLRFDDLVYTDRWTDLVDFADMLPRTIGPDTLAIFDLDQTLWAPKGVHDAPLRASRTRAIERMIDEYVVDSDSDVARQAKDRINRLYAEISDLRYISALTLDNEDFKAAICVFIALNAVADYDNLALAGDLAKQQFRELAAVETDDYCKLIVDRYLPQFTGVNRNGSVNIRRFIAETLSTAQSRQYGAYTAVAGIRVDRMVEDLRDIFDRTVDGAPVSYIGFREAELEEALSCTARDIRLQDRLVLNKPVWDFALWLRSQGVHLMGLSDRPDESTVAPNGNSLLDASMTIYGKPIESFLPS